MCLSQRPEVIVRQAVEQLTEPLNRAYESVFKLFGKMACGVTPTPESREHLRY